MLIIFSWHRDWASHEANYLNGAGGYRNYRRANAMTAPYALICLDLVGSARLQGFRVVLSKGGFDGYAGLSYVFVVSFVRLSVEVCRALHARLRYSVTREDDTYEPGLATLGS